MNINQHFPEESTESLPNITSEESSSPDQQFDQHISPEHLSNYSEKGQEFTAYLTTQEDEIIDNEIKETEQDIHKILQELQTLEDILQQESDQIPENTPEQSSTQSKIWKLITNINEEIKYINHLSNLEGIKSVFLSNTLERHSNPQENNTWNNPETLRANKQAYLKEIEKLATEKGT